MYIFVQTVDSKQKEKIVVSKKTTIETLKKVVSKAFDVDTDKQRLFFRGKQLVDSYLLVDYNINLNDVVQLFIQRDVENKKKSPVRHVSDPVKLADTFELSTNERTVQQSKYYKVNDIVDVKDAGGNWIPGRLKDIFEKTNPETKEIVEYNFIVDILDSDRKGKYPLKYIRPYSRETVAFDVLKEGDVVLANHCIENPDHFGYWYSCVVKKVKKTRRPSIIVELILGSEENESLTTLCEIKYVDKVYKLANPKPLSERTVEEDVMIQSSTALRETGPDCIYCNDSEGRNCKHCGCQKCYGKNEPDKLILCDECDLSYHIWCLEPELEKIPDEDYWYCPTCKNDDEIVKAGEGVKIKKRSAEDNRKTNRDWGKGMACVGRTAVCTIVGLDHFGPIPAVEVGSSWKFRFQVAEAGVHRPQVAGIHGRENDGAYSIVLSGGYEDDVDDGEKFIYTGSGGRDLSGNKRTAEQSSDQKLTRMNKALALNCNAPFNDILGATSEDWKNGKPVRVVRNFKLRKSSKYAPEEGNRYDGIYKVVSYFPKKGKSGYIVWRFKLQRDDPAPAPWTKKGKELIDSLGLQMTYPEGYESNDKPFKVKFAFNNQTEKRKHDESIPEEVSSPIKKIKVLVKFSLNKEVRECIQGDVANDKQWSLLKDNMKFGKQKFLKEVEDGFKCVCCHDLVNDPITTPCQHNICKSCLERSFKAEVYSCSSCRHQLGAKYTIQVNDNLKKALLLLFPGYNIGR